jgi:hypothetical protein
VLDAPAGSAGGGGGGVGGRWKTEERDEAAIFTTGAGRLLGFQKHANRARASNFTDVDFFF